MPREELSARDIRDISDTIWNTHAETDIIELRDKIKQILQRRGIPELEAIEEAERIKDEVKYNLNYKIEEAVRTGSKPKFRFSDFEPYRIIGTAHIASGERRAELLELSRNILEYMSDCNAMLESMRCEPIFAATSNTFKNISVLTSMVKNKNDLGNFLDALYMLFYDDVSENKDLLIPKTYYEVSDGVDKEDFIIFEIKVLRNFYRHDWLAWTNPEGRTEDMAGICSRYTQKTHVSMLSVDELYKFQIDLLKNVFVLIKQIDEDLKANKHIEWIKKVV